MTISFSSATKLWTINLERGDGTLVNTFLTNAEFQELCDMTRSLTPVSGDAAIEERGYQWGYQDGVNAKKGEASHDLCAFDRPHEYVNYESLTPLEKAKWNDPMDAQEEQAKIDPVSEVNDHEPMRQMDNYTEYGEEVLKRAREKEKAEELDKAKRIVEITGELAEAIRAPTDYRWEEKSALAIVKAVLELMKL